MNEVSLKEFIQVQIQSLKEALKTEVNTLRSELKKNDEQNVKQQQALLDVVERTETTVNIFTKKFKKEVEDVKKTQATINTRVFIWLSVLSLLVVFSLVGLASEAGSLLGIIVNAF